MVIWTTVIDLIALNCDVGSIWKSLQMWLLATLRLLPCLPHHHHSKETGWLCDSKLLAEFHAIGPCLRATMAPKSRVTTSTSPSQKISFGGIPNSRNVLLSEACCQAKCWNLLWNPVEPDLAAPKPPRPSPETFPEPC